MSKIAVEVSSLTKYFYDLSELTGFKAMLNTLLKRRKIVSKYKVLDNISFSVKKGESIAIIGRNGSGKSTLLYLISGILRPSAGTIKTNGRISFILELGTGFHYELSGLENILLNAVLLGMSISEAKTKLDKIIEFSELKDHIYKPLKTYSSGMIARLAFSIAIHMDPEILLIDEVLAVGDRFFREKCFQRIKMFRESGVTIILVSHNENDVTALCDRAILLEEGRIKADGNPEEILELYRKYKIS